MPLSATIKIIGASDSSFINQTRTDSIGRFEFSSIPYKSILIEISALGYQKVRKNLELSENRITFILLEEINQLRSVQISTKKPFIERSGGKTTMNIENSAIAAGNSAFDLLAKMPGVTIAQNGSINVNGKSGVQVLIDGKSTYLSAEQLSKRLKSLNSSEIKLIELSSNPSARFDAEGTAGLINIKLKKNENSGTNGTLEASYGYGKNAKSDFGISLNHRTDKLNIYGQLSNNYTKQDENLSVSRISEGASSSTYFQQENAQTRTVHNYNYKVGLDFLFNPKNTLGFLTSGYSNSGHDISNGRTDIGSTFNTIDSTVFADNPTTSLYRNQSYNLNYKSAIDTSGQEFTFDLDFVRYRSEENIVYNNNFADVSGNTYRMQNFRNTTPTNIKIWTAKADYTLPFSQKGSLDFGLKSSWVRSDNNFIFENAVGSEWLNDLTRSNQFVYTENINAAYGIFKYHPGATNIELGLRLEQTNSTGNSITDNRVVKQGYWNLFPNISVSQVLSYNHDLSFSYSRRINRPDYKSLNPFLYFVDLYTFVQGNPFLNPEYSHNFDLSYQYKKKFNASFSYSRTNNLIMDVF